MTIEDEIRLLKEKVALLEKVKELQDMIAKIEPEKVYVPYPVYPTHPTYPYQPPWYYTTTGGNVQFTVWEQTWGQTVERNPMTIEDEIRLLKEKVALLEKVKELQDMIAKIEPEKVYVPYPVYPTHPTYPYQPPWYYTTTGGNVQFTWTVSGT